MAFHDVLARLGEQPFVLLFLVVAAGYGLGRLQIKGVGLGATASTLIIALAVSLLAASGGAKFAIPEFASVVFFNLFMFSIGMKVGPQFISGLRRDAGRFIALALVIPGLSVALMLLWRALFDLAPGIAAGMFAGSNTATPGLGAAQAAYAGAGDQVLGNLSTAFALSYCVSMVLFIVMMKVAPAVAGVDLKKSAQAFETDVLRSGAPLPGAADGFLGGPLPVDVRAYSLKAEGAVGRRLDELRKAYPLVSIERIRRGSHIIDARGDLELRFGDTLALHGQVPRLLAAGPRIGPEVSAPEICDVGRETVEVVVERPQVDGRTLLDLARDVGHGVYLNAIFRGGEEIPKAPDTVVRKGDVLRITGGRFRIGIIEKEVGTVIRPSLTTDIVTLALGLAAGGLIGMITIPAGPLKITLGAAVGLLLVGIVLSTLRTRNPKLGGPFPEPARRLLEDLGLNVFIAIVGLNAGAGMLAAMGAGTMLPILLGCLVVGFVPALVAWLLGRYVLRMNHALLLGAVAGGRCNSAGLRAAQEASASNVPAISYPVTFAIANVLFTFLAYVIALLG